MNSAVIGLGSNIDPQAAIPRALARLQQQYPGLIQSRFVQTAPIGRLGQPDFLNGAVLISTERPLKSLRDELKQMEAELGRERTADRFAPRVIDLDVVVFNGAVVDEDFYHRDFLRCAVQELLPGFQG